MTQVAGRSGRNVVQGLARRHRRRHDRQTVTLVTFALRYLGVVHQPRQRYPRRRPRRMTRQTFVGGSGVVRRLATGDSAVMTTETGSDHLTVVDPVHHHRFPQGRELIVAGIADIGGRDMQWRFAAGDYRVMAADTIIAE